MKRCICKWIRLARCYAFSKTSFWKLEAHEWERLYKEQRGGPAFDNLQQELANARSEIRRLKKLLQQP